MHEFRLAATLHTEGNTPAAVQHLQRALELDPENARAHLLEGYIFMERGAFMEAEPKLRRGIELLGEQGGAPAALAEARNLHCACLINMSRQRDAIAVCRESATDLLNTAPHHAWGNLGLAHLELGEHEEAMEALGQSVRGQPRFCRGYYLMARVEFERGRFDACEEHGTRAIEADDLCTQGYQEAYRLRGECRARLHHREDAIADFERCVEISQNTQNGEACERFLDGTTP